MPDYFPAPALMPLTLVPDESPQSTSVTKRRDAAIAWLYSRINYEATPPARRGRQALKLQRMLELSERLGGPGLSIPTIHIAGTKGKGSTAAMTASILHAAGYRTGLFTSPHLEQIEERFCVDGSIATQSEFVELVHVVRPVVEEMDAACVTRGGRGGSCQLPQLFGPTFFEICTALALLHFERRQVEAIVLEVGLGGRLDATNICRPSVCAITSISYDHTRQLGNTLAEIAREKAGIIKPGVPIVSGVTSPEPRAVIEQIAAERGAPLIQLGRDFAFDYRLGGPDTGNGALWSTFDYVPANNAADGRLVGLPLPLLGEHQAANAAVTLAMIKELMRQGWKISKESLHDGFSQIRLPARAEIVRQGPTVLLDTAHNVASVRALANVLPTLSPVRRRRLVFAATQDKDVAGMLEVLLPLFDTVWLTQYKSNPRGVPLEQLTRYVEGCRAKLRSGLPHRVYAYESPLEAWQAAAAAADSDDLICITGSFFLAAELRQVVCSE